MINDLETGWYKSLKKSDMLELATVLSKHALLAWNNFHLNSVTKHELITLPERALSDIESTLDGFPPHKINEHFSSFITPVIHIRDGYLKFPYEVRLAFLSVFHILQGMVSNDHLTSAEKEFAASISKSIDAIKIAGILTAAEVSVITHKYYLLAKNG